MSSLQQPFHGQFDEALRSTDPFGQVREVVRGLLAEGHERDALYAELQHYVVEEPRAAGRDDDEDVVFDVMDYLIGRCGPGAAL